MLAKTPLKDQMLAFLETKRSNEKYNWLNCHHCACAQFAESVGRSEEWYDAIRGGGPVPNVQEWKALDCVARGSGEESWTFGKMRKRLLEYA